MREIAKKILNICTGICRTCTAKKIGDFPHVAVHTLHVLLQRAVIFLKLAISTLIDAPAS
jgi:hypothetical protein